MAKEEKSDKTAPKKKGGAKIILFMTFLGCLVPFGVPTLIVCLGFLPTLVTLFTEKDPRHPALAAIGYMNAAGVLPFLIDLWEHGQTMEAALAIVRQPQTWVVILGAAGIGQLILFIVPPFVASMITLKQESRLRTLQEGIEQLEAIWGKEVTTTSPVEKVRLGQGAE